MQHVLAHTQDAIIRLIKHWWKIMMYENCILLFNIIHICSWDLNFTNIIKSRICWKQSGHTHYLLLWLLLLLHQYTASLFWMSAICLALFDPWSWRHHDQESLAWHSITAQNNLNPKPLSCEQWRTQEFFFRWGGSTNSVEDRGQRERRSGGGSPPVRGSGGSCNLVQEISFHIIKFS